MQATWLYRHMIIAIWHLKNNVHGEHEKYRTGACSIAILELQEQKIP